MAREKQNSDWDEVQSMLAGEPNDERATENANGSNKESDKESGKDAKSKKSHSKSKKIADDRKLKSSTARKKSGEANVALALDADVSYESSVADKIEDVVAAVAVATKRTKRAETQDSAESGDVEKVAKAKRRRRAKTATPEENQTFTGLIAQIERVGQTKSEQVEPSQESVELQEPAFEELTIDNLEIEKSSSSFEELCASVVEKQNELEGVSSVFETVVESVEELVAPIEDAQEEPKRAEFGFAANLDDPVADFSADDFDASISTDVASSEDASSEDEATEGESSEDVVDTSEVAIEPSYEELVGKCEVEESAHDLVDPFGTSKEVKTAEESVEVVADDSENVAVQEETQEYSFASEFAEGFWDVDESLDVSWGRSTKEASEICECEVVAESAKEERADASSVDDFKVESTECDERACSRSKRNRHDRRRGGNNRDDESDAAVEGTVKSATEESDSDIYSDVGNVDFDSAESLDSFFASSSIDFEGVGFAPRKAKSAEKETASVADEKKDEKKVVAPCDENANVETIRPEKERSDRKERSSRTERSDRKERIEASQKNVEKSEVLDAQDRRSVVSRVEEDAEEREFDERLRRNRDHGNKQRRRNRDEERVAETRESEGFDERFDEAREAFVDVESQESSERTEDKSERGSRNSRRREVESSDEELCERRRERPARREREVVVETTDTDEAPVEERRPATPERVLPSWNDAISYVVKYNMGRRLNRGRNR